MAQLTLKVIKVKQKNLSTKAEGYASRVISNGIADFDAICKEASKNTTLHPRELELAFGLALDAVSDALQDGKIVELDQIGRLYPSIQSKWTATADEQKLSNFTKRVTFRPAQAITTAIQGAKLTWATEKEAKEAENNGTATDTDTTGGDTTGGGTSSGETSGGDTSGGDTSGGGSSSDSGGANL